MTNKSAEKSASRNGRRLGVPFVRGADSRRGCGPRKGAPNAGRPPDEFKEYCRRLLATPGVDKEIESVLQDSSHPAYAAMWKTVADRAYGRAVQAVELTGRDGASVIPVEAIQAARERVLVRLDSLARQGAKVPAHNGNAQPR
ncbi:MAG: hypothetical protein ACR2G6_09665 [Gemmatimonadaceae bacterium]